MQRITLIERQIIELGIRKGLSYRKIANHIKRDHSVVSREINRNTGNYLPYTASSAQRIAEQRARKTNRSKLEKDKVLKDYVETQLKQDLSPQQIAGRLKSVKAPLELSGRTISHESIYQYIYTGEGRIGGLFLHLRRGKSKRQRKRSRKPKKVLIPQRISIHARSEEINEKRTYGHWESDTMVQHKQKDCLSVQYERKSLSCRIHRICNKSSEETEYAIRESISSLPQWLFKSMTFDNGGEGACHTKLRDDYGIETYFCDAYASWQKGGVENINGLIRQYIPKKKDLSELTDQNIYEIQEKLNNRPRKQLNYLTPNEVLAMVMGH